MDITIFLHMSLSAICIVILVILAYIRRFEKRLLEAEKKISRIINILEKMTTPDNFLKAFNEMEKNDYNKK